MPVEHRVLITDDTDLERSYWECSCGHSGSCTSDRADIASDKHIKYYLGETRTDVSKLD